MKRQTSEYRGPRPSSDPRTGCVAPALHEPAQYDVVLGADGAKIGYAFEVSNSDIVIELAALPMSGQARLVRKVAP